MNDQKIDDFLFSLEHWMDRKIEEALREPGMFVDSPDHRERDSVREALRQLLNRM